ncbi:CheR family methyltransferase [Desulfocurvibacter africanus]|uniref:CheR family methyltransferase n=1 Tax=Desulfocurvibacter africanus TaxID=873 RepID=UPI00041A50BA|nr:CheR family methyltransferase [Desulfocurvibacter africanus]
MPSSSLSPETMERLSRFVGKYLGLHFPVERHKDLLRGVARAAVELGRNGPEALVEEILAGRANRHVLDNLAGQLTIGETYFFRDKRLLDLLREEVLPGLLRRASREGRPLRIWSAGCCTGEEPYTVAILLKELMRGAIQVPVSILATDLNPRFLDKAQRAIYRQWSFRATPSRIRNAWFRSLPDEVWELSPDIRSMVSLACLNLAVDAYPALENRTNAQDLILCRNVLMYFSPQLGQKVVTKLHGCLVDGGLLVVGPSEGSLVTSSGLFSVDLNERGILYCRESCRIGQPAPNITSMPEPTEPDLAGPPALPVQDSLPAAGLLDRKAAGEASLIEQALHEARAAVERGCYAEAGERLASVDRSGLSPAQSGLLANLTARMLAGSGDLALAERTCREAIAADKMHAAHHYLLAVILQELRRLKEAVEALQKALYLEPGFLLAHFSLGLLLKELGREQESRRSLKNALAGLQGLDREGIVPESEGMTAGRITEIIQAMIG